ncbi:MAG: hypothetical protein HRT45_01620 [Bdellovibrionales bacterium]|nr:hypothetical protein [Bdellovibrionales bacterium]
MSLLLGKVKSYTYVMNSFILLAASLFVVGPVLSIAAPHPATSSSFVVGADSGRYFSENGFKVSLGKSKWQKAAPPKSFQTIEVIFKGPQSNTGEVAPSLTVRRDDLKQPMGLERYVKQWRKDYPRFGFNILNSQRVTVGANIGFMLDLVHAETSNQLRQVVFVKDRQAVIFTCRDKKASFRQSLSDCNEIVRTFKWTL